MDRIILITTKGCVGCDIMRNNIKEALTHTKKQVDFTEKSRSDLSKYFLVTNNIKDFPTVLFIRGNTILRREVGTRPYAVILRWIDIDFV